MKHFLIAAVLAALLCQARGDQVDDYVSAEMAKAHVPGLTLEVIQNGKPAKSAAYGFANLELKVPATLDTVFEIGSVTKQFTAACALLLENEGKLAVRDPISKYLATAPAAWSNITIRHLLTHTSGIKSYTGLSGFELTRRLTQEQFIAALARLPLEFAPGAQAKYSNSGYNLLGYIIENASGKSYWEFLAGRIFGPLNMTTATNRDPTILVPNRADGYLHKDGAFMNRDSDLTDVFSAGSIVCAIGDLARWNSVLDGESLLSASMKARMWTPAKLNGGRETPYGFGWRIGEFQGRKNIGHSGSTSGFSASLQRFPDDRLAVIVLCNSGEPNIATTIAKGIAAIRLREGKSE